MTVRTEDALVDWAEIQDIELVILRRMKEVAAGAHPSVFHGAGFDLAGLRDWEPGDRPSAIDWAQSSLTNFSPLVTREFEQESTASVLIMADTSLSTRCGVNGVPIARMVARVVATLGLAGAFFQDRVGLITFDGPTRRMAVRPRVGKNHALHCLEAYQKEVLGSAARPDTAGDGGVAGLLRRRSLVPVVSDFLTDDPAPLIKELSDAGAVHDVFLVMIDSAFAFELPPISAGWIEGYDVETGRTRVISTTELEDLGRQVRGWQDRVQRAAHDAGLEVVRLEGDLDRFNATLAEFLGNRRLHRRRA